MRSFLISALIIAAGVYFIILVWLYLSQRALLYLPDQTRYAPEDAGFSAMQAVTFEAADGLTLESWYQKAEPGKPTILYFHGNAANLLNHSYIAHPLVAAGYGVLLLEYRGYGGNPGKPTEEGLYADARAALKFLVSQGVGPAETVLFGQSLGTGVAVKMASEIKPKALILQSPYTSIAKVAQHHYWYVPVKWLVKDRFPAEDFIGKNTAPLLVIGARNDTVIPFKFSKRLYTAAKKPKTLKTFDNAGHNDLGDNGGIRAVLEFLESLNK